MTIAKMKELVYKNKGVEHNFIFHGARNQNEKFKGVITAIYPAIFIITLDSDQVRAYSYSDLLISNLEIVD